MEHREKYYALAEESPALYPLELKYPIVDGAKLHQQLPGFVIEECPLQQRLQELFMRLDNLWFDGDVRKEREYVTNL